jgi:hypothetical protein
MIAKSPKFSFFIINIIKDIDKNRSKYYHIYCKFEHLIVQLLSYNCPVCFFDLYSSYFWNIVTNHPTFTKLYFPGKVEKICFGRILKLKPDVKFF